MRWLPILAAVALAGCISRPEYSEPDPTPIEVTPLPPTLIMRRAPEFTFKDYVTGKQYYYRTYSDGEITEEIVTVLAPGAETEALATIDEQEYAMQIMAEDWAQKGLEERLAYHKKVMDRDQARRDSLLGDRVHFAERALAQMRESLFLLECDLNATRATPGYVAPPGRVEFLEREITATKVQIIEEQAKLDSLRFLKAQRDKADVRSSRTSR